MQGFLAFYCLLPLPSIMWWDRLIYVKYDSNLLPSNNIHRFYLFKYLCFDSSMVIKNFANLFFVSDSNFIKINPSVQNFWKFLFSILLNSDNCIERIRIMNIFFQYVLIYNFYFFLYSCSKSILKLSQYIQIIKKKLWNLFFANHLT